MKNLGKNKKQLVREVAEPYQRIAKLNAAETGHKNKKDSTDQNFAHLLNVLSEGIIVTDEKKRIVFINHAAKIMLNVGDDDLINHPVARIFHDIAPIKQLTAFLSQKNPPESMDIELPGPHPEESRFLQADISTAKVCEKIPDGYIITLKDVTRQSKIEKFKNEFITTMSHEFQTPLSIILGYTELLLKGKFSLEDRNVFLTYIYEKAEFLTQLVDELLDFNRPEDGRKIGMGKKAHDAKKIFLQSISEFRKEAGNLSVEIDMPEAPVTLFVDALKIKQALENLLKNASKNTDEKNTVKAKGELTDTGWFHFSIKGQGSGMKTEQEDRISGKCRLPDNSITPVDEISLRTSIAKHIITSHGGKMWMEDSPGKDAAVHFTLPTLQD